MKKTIAAAILGAVMAFALYACGSGSSASAPPAKEATPSQLAEAAASSDAAASSVSAEASSATAADEAYYLGLMEKNFDMSKYKRTGDGYSSDNHLSKPIESVEIAGKTLRFGMTYDELIKALGSDITVPEGLADMETKGGNVVVLPLSSFKTADGKGFTLLFAGEKGATVKDGALAAAENGAESNPALIAVNGVTSGSSMADVVAALGSPTDIKGHVDKDGNTIDFSYTYSGDDGVSKVKITFNRDSVSAVSAQGLMS